MEGLTYVYVDDDFYMAKYGNIPMTYIVEVTIKKLKNSQYSTVIFLTNE